MTATVPRRPALLLAGTAALAVFAGCLHTAASERAERVDTRGYRLVPPRSLGGMPWSTGLLERYVGVVDCAGAPSDADCYQGQTEVLGIGISPSDANRIVPGAVGSGANYHPPGDEYVRYVAFRGLQGRVSDPEKALRRMIDSLHRGEQMPFPPASLRWDGPYRTVPLGPYDGAVMKCRQGEEVHVQAGRPERRTPNNRCVWADRSTVAVTEADLPVRKLAELTAELYRTARVKAK
ncbi:hypothetical protein AB0A99_20990 [Streptomyces fradiae]|uniref:hypothetical protein n=1 Tax=Streptomyces fradiae TaxID=1906 RepID=UPI00340D0DD9